MTSPVRRHDADERRGGRSRPGAGARRRGPFPAGEVIAVGTPASPGRRTGPVTVVRNLDDFPRFRRGDVLVCRATSPAWTPLLALASAVVTETGGILAHAAVVAREFGIPAVLAVDDAMRLLDDAATVVVDGDLGVVSEPLPDEVGR